MSWKIKYLSLKLSIPAISNSSVPTTEIIEEKQRIMIEVFRKSQVDTQIVINGMRREIKSLRTMVDKIPRINQDLDNLYNRYKDIRDEKNIFREIGILRNNSLKSE
jgi:hypothetical protein